MLRYIRNVGVGFDSFVNAVTGGDPDSTISLRIAQASARGSKLGKIGCWFLSKAFRSNHCADAEGSEEGIEDQGAR